MSYHHNFPQGRPLTEDEAADLAWEVLAGARRALRSGPAASALTQPANHGFHRRRRASMQSQTGSTVAYPVGLRACPEFAIIGASLIAGFTGLLLHATF